MASNNQKAVENSYKLVDALLKKAVVVLDAEERANATEVAPCMPESRSIRNLTSQVYVLCTLALE